MGQQAVPPRAGLEEAVGRIEAFIKEEMKVHDLPAVSIALVEGKQVVWAKGYGYAIWRMGHDFKDARQVLGSVRGWLWDSVNNDIDNLTGKSEKQQREYLQTVVVFRGYYEKTGDYPTLYENLNKLRNELLAPAKRPNEIPEAIWTELGTHYLIFGPLPMKHGQMVKQNLPDALKAMDLAGKNSAD